MENFEVTSMSSRGQVVIPQAIRQELGLTEGAKFIVIGEEDTLLLKRIGVPSFANFDKLIEKTRAFAQKKGIKPEDVSAAIKRARG